ncbi:hypothetical protein NQD34_014582 [Periophthalmus magnuspinnatus]|nr:hypothetical protein NQD34_014582 [Periophthalmus magnuspinnatus]
MISLSVSEAVSVKSCDLLPQPQSELRSSLLTLRSTMASCRSQVAKEGPGALVQEFESHKRRLDQIIASLKSITDKISDRREDQDRRVMVARDQGRQIGVGAGILAGVLLGPVAGAGIGGLWQCYWGIKMRTRFTRAIADVTEKIGTK